MNPEQPSESAAPAVVELTPRQRWRTFFFCLLGWLFDHYDFMLFAYIAGKIGKEWDWGAAANHNKAFLLGIALLMSGVGGVVCGGLADRFGRRRVMGWTILMYSLCTGLSGLAVGLVSLAFFRALTGFGFGGEWAAGHALLAETFPRQHRGVAAALLSAGQPVGSMLAILAGLWLGQYVHWRVLFLLGAAPALMVLFLQRYVPESPLWLAQQARSRPGFLEPYRILLRDHWWRALQGLILGTSKLGTYWLTIAWLPEYFHELEMTHLGIPMQGAAVVAQTVGAHVCGVPGLIVGPSIQTIVAGEIALTVAPVQTTAIQFQVWVQVTLFVGMILFGPLADRIGRRPTFSLYALIMAGGFLSMSCFGQQMMENRAWFWLAMSAVGLGSGCTAGFGPLLAELFPTSIRNTAMGTVFNLSRSFQFITQPLMAIIAARAGVASGLLLALAFALVTAVWVWTLPETRGIALRND